VRGETEFFVTAMEGKGKTKKLCRSVRCSEVIYLSSQDSFMNARTTVTVMGVTSL
jgi:hypothetical protein